MLFPLFKQDKQVNTETFLRRKIKARNNEMQNETWKKVSNDFFKKLKLLSSFLLSL